jgi:Peptidase family M1 domain
VQPAESGVPGAIPRPQVLALGLALLGLPSGCEAPARPHATPVPEPTQALRPAASRGDVHEAARVVDYALTARYDEDLHRIDGRARITWHNRGPQAVQQLPLHLYMNGFRAADTAWMEQARGEHRGKHLDAKDPWGYIDVATVERVGGEGSDGTPARTGLRHAEGEDPSLMTVWLDEPVPPGQALELELAFTTKLPRVFARTGFADRYVMAGQWFPKLGVLEPDGTWKAHVFTLYSEFYADFGHYDVELDLPGDLVVGATGILVSHEHEGARQRLRYHAEMVHDFAWTAGPELVEAWDEHEGIRIRALVPRERAHEAPLHLAAQRAALASMEARFGPYPWSTITLVDPPAGAEGAGGMEYPTFYTTSPIEPLPRVVEALGFHSRLGTFTTIHEFGHQYFQGLLASDEFTQPWLDEGLNTFANTLVYMDEQGDEQGDANWVVKVAGHPLSMLDGLRYTHGERWHIEVIDQTAAAFTPLAGGYGAVTYIATAATLHTLRRLAGPARFDAALREYAHRFRFRHPTGADLEATLAEVLGPRVVLGHTAQGAPIELELAEFFEQALRTTREVDFRVHKLVNNPRLATEHGPAGWHRDEHGVLVGGEPPPERPPEGWAPEDLEGVVVVLRAGEFEVPVEVEVELSDGTRERVLWDGRGRYRVLRWPGKKLVWAKVDPDGKLVLEGKRHDNTRYAAGQRPAATMSTAMARVSEATALAIAGGLGP